MKEVVSMGAVVVTTFDVGSDIYTISYYNSIGEGETARWMLTFVILSMVLQMISVVAIHHKTSGG